MSLILDYQTHALPPASTQIPRVILPILLTFAHINLCWQISTLLLNSVNSSLVPPAHVWCAAAWAPGAAVMNACGILPGLVLVLSASTLAGILAYDLLRRQITHVARPAGRFAWRLGAVVILWCMWLPVPSDCSFVWQFRMWAVYS